MSPQIGNGETNSAAYWNDLYARGRFPSLGPDNILRYQRVAVHQKGPSALDVACGQAALGAILLNRHPTLTYVGIDYSLEAIQRHVLRMEDSERFALYCGDWRDLPAVLNGQRFSTVYLCEILEHEPDPVAMLEVLAPLATERLVVTVPRHQVLSWPEHRGEHAWDFTEEELVNLLAPYGKVGPFEHANHICWTTYVDMVPTDFSIPVMDRLNDNTEVQS